MKEARDRFLESDSLHPLKQIRMAQLYRSTAGGDLASLDKSRVDLLSIR